MKNTSGWNKWLLGGLGWALGGPIGGIVGFALGAVTEESGKQYKPGTTRCSSNDFSAALLVLCAAVMKADNRLLKSELEYIRQFFTRNFGAEHTQQRMLLLREILKQDIPLSQVCAQIRQNVDHSSRLELLHLLFGVANSDGEISDSELVVLEQIAHLTGISQKDLTSIRAMFVQERGAAYKILEIEKTASIDDIKKAYRKMAMKYHPDKVHHLGQDYMKDAQEKFRKINKAYEQLKKERGFLN
jgi:DnaJ like chaperone protein